MSNTITVLGNLGNDAEMINVNGTPLLKFNIGCSIGFGAKKRTVWYRCEWWNPANIAQWLTKGSQVFVSGVHMPDEYTDKQGVVKKVDTVRVNDVNIVHSKSGNDNNNNQQGAPQQNYQQNPPQQNNGQVPPPQQSVPNYQNTIPSPETDEDFPF